jgi:hypothetical protein
MFTRISSAVGAGLALFLARQLRKWQSKLFPTGVAYQLVSASTNAMHESSMAFHKAGSWIWPQRNRLIRLHDLAHKDVKLSVFLFAHFGDFVRPQLIASHFRPLSRRHVPRWKFDNDARR